MKFTESQIDAIRHGDTNLQLIACAGSGKTEVVAQRIANLLKAGLKPANIIAFTFTDKAAAELKDRIVTRCREALGDVYGLAEMYVGTIHGFCLDLLMTEVHDALKFSVLNEVQQTLSSIVTLRPADLRHAPTSMAPCSGVTATPTTTSPL
jgi:DNA helicase-2/ATP-dependent DNA helicase PcrA